MTAAVLDRPIGPDGIDVREVPVPVPGPGEALVRVHASTVISSELSTLWGVADPSGPSYPMTLGNEFAGVVVSCPGGELPEGQPVTTAWAGHGWTRDGGQAQYVVSPAADLLPYRSTLPFTTVAAMPKAFTRAHLARTTLNWQPGQSLLVRGGTTAIGLAVAGIAAADGAHVLTTTRSAEKAELLRARGIGEVLLDDGGLVERVRERYPNGVDDALELLGYPAVIDSLRCVRTGGTVAMIGLLQEQAHARATSTPMDGETLIAPSPFHYIPNGVRLTTANHKSLKPSDSLAGLFGGIQEWLDRVEAGELSVAIDREFTLTDIRDAYRYLAAQSGIGKVVIRID